MPWLWQIFSPIGSASCINVSKWIIFATEYYCRPRTDTTNTHTSASRFLLWSSTSIDDDLPWTMHMRRVVETFRFYCSALACLFRFYFYFLFGFLVDAFLVVVLPLSLSLWCCSCSMCMFHDITSQRPPRSKPSIIILPKSLASSSGDYITHDSHSLANETENSSRAL